jgi:hypothetical protein
LERRFCALLSIGHSPTGYQCSSSESVMRIVTNLWPGFFKFNRSAAKNKDKCRHQRWFCYLDRTALLSLSFQIGIRTPEPAITLHINSKTTIQHKIPSNKETTRRQLPLFKSICTIRAGPTRETIRLRVFLIVMNNSVIAMFILPLPPNTQDAAPAFPFQARLPLFLFITHWRPVPVVSPVYDIFPHSPQNFREV